MNESSLLNEYQKLLPGAEKLFVIPQIPDINKNTSYLYQLYKDYLNPSSRIKIETFNAAFLPKIFFSKLKSEKSILHYHWFEFEDFKSFVGIKWKLFWIILYKLLGGKIVWTVHNYYPHHNKYIFWNLKARRLLAKLAHRLHIHCRNEIDNLSAILKTEKKKFFVVKHPDFNVDIFEREKAINLLNQKYFNNKINYDDKIFLMFGAIAEYKGIKEVIEIFNNLDKKNKLIIAGFIKRHNKSYFYDIKSSENEKILIEGSNIPDDDVPFFFNAADYLIFNYKNILTSGGIVLAMNSKKNIIAPDSGCIKEINYPHLLKFNRKDITLAHILHSL